MDSFSACGALNPHGAYIVKLCDGGSWKYTILDDHFPCKAIAGNLGVFAY